MKKTRIGMTLVIMALVCFSNSSQAAVIETIETDQLLYDDTWDQNIEMQEFQIVSDEAETEVVSEIEIQSATEELGKSVSDKLKTAEEDLIKEAEEKKQKEKEELINSSEEVKSSFGLNEDYDAVLAMTAMDYLVNEEGFSVEGAAGLIGNAYAECTFKVNCDNGSHFGIFQWDYNDRWPRIANWLEDNGYEYCSRHDDYSDLSHEMKIEIFMSQLKAALHSEDADYYSNTIEYCKNASSASESADRWRAKYEVCGAAKSKRINTAEKTAALYNSLF